MAIWDPTAKYNSHQYFRLYVTTPSNLMVHSNHPTSGERSIDSGRPSQNGLYSHILNFTIPKKSGEQHLISYQLERFESVSTPHSFQDIDGRDSATPVSPALARLDEDLKEAYYAVPIYPHSQDIWEFNRRTSPTHSHASHYVWAINSSKDIIKLLSYFSSDANSIILSLHSINQKRGCPSRGLQPSARDSFTKWSISRAAELHVYGWCHHFTTHNGKSSHAPRCSPPTRMPHY